jgi:hypothetical protein
MDDFPPIAANLAWRKSTYSGSGDECVEVTVLYTSQLRWRKSSHSGGNGGSCVEVAGLADKRIAVRDSKNEGPVMIFTAVEWRSFIGGVKDGRFGGVSH